jgi:DNA-directed RNA polymerase subunit beta
MNNLKLFINNISDLTESQRASFYNFLSKGIIEELNHLINPLPIILTINKKKKLSLLYLYSTEIKIKGPLLTIHECRKRDITYAIQIYIKGEYSYFSQKLIKKNLFEKPIRIQQDLFLTEIPFMTEEGTFFINGCERVVINQIIRSPGIYFKKEFNNNSNEIIYTATIISNKGLWTKIYLEEINSKKKNFLESLSQIKEHIYIKLNNLKIKNNEDNNFLGKLLLIDIIKYFGLTLQEILDNLNNKNIIIEHKIFEYQNIDSNKNLSNKIIRNLFFNEKFNCFSIGEIGRYKFNKRLNINLPLTLTYLTAHDFIAIIDQLIELKYNNLLTDDIDDIKNKQIRSIGELLQNQFRIGLHRLKKNIFEEEDIENSEEKFLEKSSQQFLKKYLKSTINSSNKTIKFEDWIIDPKFITSSIKEFFKTSQLSQFMDQINPLAEITHKRRISVFGPNGLKRDHINTVIRDIHPSQYGRLCPIDTPEGQNAGLISSIALYARLNNLGNFEVPYFLIKNKKIEINNQPFYLNSENESNLVIAFSDIKLFKTQFTLSNYLSGKENYLFILKKLSNIKYITTSPLQIISLATSLIPFLEHDDANRVLMGANMQRQAVPLVFSQKPLVGTGFETISILDSEMIIKSYSEGIVFSASANKIKIIDKNNQLIIYILKKYKRSNQNTSLNQKPIIWNGEKVFSGQIIADGPGTKDGELALGQNLTIAYMPWEGYNYEDAIVINERLVIENNLTSIHLEECNLDLTDYFLGKEKLTNQSFNITEPINFNLNSNGIIKKGIYVYENDILVGKVTPLDEELSPELKIFKAIYGKVKPNYKNTSLRVPHGIQGRVIDIRLLSTIIGEIDETELIVPSEIIRIFIAQIRKIQVGDKIAGRHGNKGIISKILAKQDMPFLPDGTSIDILLNPLGVPSRMNVGQVFECLLGLAGKNLEKRFKISPFDEIYGNEASRILVNQKLKHAVLKTNFKWLFNSNYPGKILLRDGRTGEFFDNPITVGKSYILKLIHLVEDKIHARSIGPYSMITEQPLAGKSQQGGQRFGEMEVWALEAYGCAYILQELLTIKSDDIDGRNDMYLSILGIEKKSKPKPFIPEAFLALIRELNALGLDFGMNKFISDFSNSNYLNEIELPLFELLETKLKLRALLSKKQQDFFSNKEKYLEKEKKANIYKKKQKEKIFKFFRT